MEATSPVTVQVPPFSAKDVDEDMPTAAVVPAISIVSRFLEARGLERKNPPSELVTTPYARRDAAAASSTTTIARILSRPAWHGYTKRQCGDRISFARRAMRVPDDSYSDSSDVYNPKKIPTAFIKIHEEADEVSRQFDYRTRSLFFEREVVDRPVCDLEENQQHYDNELDRMYEIWEEDYARQQQDNA